MNMSFDEYVNQISQKYRLAVAISVIKTKPTNLSIEEYLTQLQDKIKDMEDPDETVCSDDFNFDEDDENENQINEHLKSNEVTNGNTDLKSNDKVTIANASEVIVNDSQESQTILNGVVFDDVAVPIEKETSIGDTIRILKEATKCQVMEEQPHFNFQNLSQSTFCESQEEPNLYNNCNNNETFCESVINSNKLYNAAEIRYFPNVIENNMDSQETQLYSLHGFSQDYTHVSQTQGEDFVLSDRFIRSKVDNTTTAKETTERVNNTFNQMQYYDDREIIEISNEINQMVNSEITKNREVANVEQCVEVTNYTDISNNTQVVDHNKENNIEIDQNNAHNEEDYNDMEVDKHSDDNTAVAVPFKVLEELNRVKTFLNRRERRSVDGYSTDSGYRSDSQIRSSFKSSSQTTGIWLNQSAHCLFTHLMTAPTSSEDITNEISQVLGQLIDKLHDEENYPQFLEELLETVDDLIRRTHEGCNWADNVLLTKDEDIQRLILLNKSKHILEHSIENITNILEKLHTNLIQENLYELTNTTEVENICYIFHILEVFLKRYLKLKNNSSQTSTQNSQEEDRFPKRSSLTELWRKKWNPNYKEMPKSQEVKSVCVLKKCSDILNKIIVECMDGYSLVAFAALQCFNLMQS